MDFWDVAFFNPAAEQPSFAKLQHISVQKDKKRLHVALFPLFLLYCNTMLLISFMTAV